MAKDIFHDAVKRALEKENWIISADPFSFKVGEVGFRIDLAAEKMLMAQKAEVKIAVEIKTFIEQSPLHAFHEAIGQYDNYLLALEEYEPDRILFLAVPLEAYNDFFQKPFIQKVLARKAVKLIIYDPQFEIIELWIK
jgi:XisH protein